MRALTLHQPWASLIACGAKRVETRRWATSYRGPLLIHAGARADQVPAASMAAWAVAMHAQRDRGVELWTELPTSVIVCSAQLVSCDLAADVLNELGDDELHWGRFGVGDYVWRLDDVKATTERCPWSWGMASFCPDGNRERDLVMLGEHFDPLCPVCDGAGVCEPIPAKGRQGLWEWSPAAR